MQPLDPEPRYSIGAAARRSGLSSHVLRAWERRYGVVAPARTSGGERLYSSADIRQLTLLRQLTHAGHSIGQIARLPVPELERLLEAEATAPAAGAAMPTPDPAGGRYVAEALEAVSAMDDERLRAVLMHALVALPAREFADELVLPLLGRVGDLWAAGEICPAHEHLLSVQIARVLGRLADTVPVSPDAPAAVAATPAGQRHEFGALLAAIVMAKQGWRVTYLGPDLPASDIAAAVRARRAEVILLSAIIDDADSLLAEIREIRAGVGDGPHIFAGGAGAARRGAALERSGARYLANLDALREALRELAPTTGSAA